MSRVSDSLSSERRRQIAFGALDLLATEGAHGLTHRRLDRSLNLPEGSTSNVFSRRMDLLRAAVDALVVSEEAVLAPVLKDPPDLPWDAETSATVLTDVLLAWLLPDNRRYLLARYTLLLEATRQQELATVMRAARNRFAALAELLCTATAGARADSHMAMQLVAYADGVLLAHLIDETTAPSADRIRHGIRLLFDTSGPE